MAPETVQAAVEPDEDLARVRRKLAFEAADAEGLLGARDTAVGGRVPSKLLAAARARSGAASTSELLLYALSKVALEDDFGRQLLARRGRVPKGTLEG